MKKLFIFLNILLTSCVGWLIYTHISHTPAAPDKILDMTPDQHSVTKVGIFDQENGSIPGNLSYIYENNIFNQNRAVVSEENGSLLASSSAIIPYKGTFELAGICRMGDTQGAVITGVGSRSSKSLRAKFYRVDEQIGETNYKLIEVSPQTHSVVISDGSSRSVLELDRNDSASSKRRESEVKKQVLASKKAEMAFNKTKPTNMTKTTNLTPPVKKTTDTPPVPPRKKTAEEIAAIRKKILERMADQKKKNKKTSNKKNR